MPVQDWFATWFNSPYYHTLYKDRNLQEAEVFVDALVSHLDLPHGARALDLACGKGRHSLHLKKKGFEVIGLDLSGESIAEAKLNEQDGLEFFEHDMRSLYWHEYFDLVVNLFTSFGYFHNKEDDQQTIASVADALKANGLFVLDFMNATKVKANLVAFEEKTIDNIRFEITRAVENGVIIKRIQVIDGDVELDFEEQVDALELSDFETYLSTAGLELVSTFGNYNLAPFDAESSDRLILVAKKHSR
ncbi:MAG: methyltransferase domain-containing protein [Flavobacteriales bacterium]|jgi:SAM-dependent methyltransferase|nr:methyltransferase domain-containing protein [Flavobacteriales bacterium]